MLLALGLANLRKKVNEVSFAKYIFAKWRFMYNSDFEFALVMAAGGEDLSKSTNSGAEVEQVHQVVGGNKSSPFEEQGTR